MNQNQEISQNLLKLYAKLLAIKKQVPYIKKDTTGFNYTYASPSAVFGKLNPLLNDNGVLLITNVIESKSYQITVQTKKGPKEEWKFDLKFIFEWVDVETGERISIPWEASGVNGEDKGLGSALTYAERYFVLKQFNIPTDDDDPDNFQEKNASAEEKEKLNNKKQEEEKTKVAEGKTAIEACTTLDQLKTTWTAIPAPIKKLLEAEKEAAKTKLQAADVETAKTAMNACTNKSQLQVVYTGLSKETKAAVESLKNELKDKLPVETPQA